MSCGSCGSYNPDENAFCTSCGKALSRPAAPQQSDTPPAEPQQSYEQPTGSGTFSQSNSFESNFRRSWREFASAPFALILLIIYTLSVAINTIEISDLYKQAEDLLKLAGEKSSLETVLTYIVAIVPGILIAIGMWMLYIDSVRKTDMPLNVNGLRLIQVVYTVLLVLYCLELVNAILKFVKALDDVPKEYVEYMFKNLMEEAGGWLLLIIGIMIMLIVAMVKIIKMTIAMRQSAEFCFPDTDHVVFVTAFLFVVGASPILLVLWVSAEYNLPLDSVDLSEIPLYVWLSLAMPFLFGAMLIKYKGLMRRLFSEKISLQGSAIYSQMTESNVTTNDNRNSSWMQEEEQKQNTPEW